MASAGLNWYEAMGVLGASFRVVAPDLRGHGRYGADAPRFSFEGCADDQAQLLGDLGLADVIAVGYSMGGAVAQELARDHAPQLRAIVLCATASSFAHHPSLRPAVRAAGRIGAGTARLWPVGAQEIVRRLVRHRAGEAVAPWVLEELALSSPVAFVEAGVALNDFDSSPWLGQLAVPVAVVVTGRDTVVPPWRQRVMAELLPAATYYVAEAGHDAVGSEPELFLPVLAQACTHLARGPQAPG
jgi:pimeloyl-ACP methyl ester carboxylesterase